jgi:hypothetical protein
VFVLTLLVASLTLLNANTASASTPAYTVGSSFSIGWWTGVGISNLARIDTQKAAGQTVQTAYFTTSVASYAPYLTKLQGDAALTFLQLDPTAVKAANTAPLVAFVNLYKNNPAVAGWLLYDEPEYNGVWASNLVTDYKAIKAADPKHPVAVIWAEGWCNYIAHSLDSNYFNSADVVMFDSYPIFNQAEFGNTSDGKHKFTDYAYTVNDCLSYTASIGKKFMITAQAFAWDSSSRNPTYNEERYFTFMPYIHNVAGVQYWIDYRADATMTSTVSTVMSEASALQTVILNGKLNDSTMSVNNSGISYKYGSNGTSTYLIAENDTANTISAKFTLPSTIHVSSVNLAYDAYNTSTKAYKARSITTTADSSGRSTFTDSFTKYQVHIYLITGTATKTATPVPTKTPTKAAAQSFQPPTNTPPAK